MQAECALRGHARSLSCEFALGASSGRASVATPEQRLGSTDGPTVLTAQVLPIMMPIALDIRHMSASSPPRLATESRSDSVDPSRILLPPSVPSSECGDEDGGLTARDPMAQTLPSDGGQSPTDMEPSPVVENRLEETKSGADPATETPGPDGNTDTTQDHKVGSSREETKDETLERADEPVPVSELLEALQAYNVQAERTQGLERQLRLLLDTCGTNSRFLPVQSRLYRQMVQCLRAEEKASFAALNSQLLSLRSMCGLGRGAPALGQLANTLDAVPMDSLESSWIHRLPEPSRSSFTSFLSRLRCDPAFLADCISRLASSQLVNLAKPHRQASLLDPLASPNPSIFSKLDTKGSPRRPSRSNKGLVSLEQLAQDPLLLLMDGLFDRSAPGGAREARRRLDAWSTVCARIIGDGKPGSDDFCLAVIELFQTPGSAGPICGLEIFLLHLIQKADPLLSMHSPTANSPKTMETKAPDFPAGSSDFVQEAIEPLLDLLLRRSQPYASSNSSLDLIRAILEKIESPEKKAKARIFFVLRWFCSQFLASALVTPEVRGPTEPEWNPCAFSNQWLPRHLQCC